AKHGQSPTDPAALVRVPDAPIIDGLNAAWKVGHPAAADLVVFSTNDDVMQLWLSDHSSGAAAFAKTYLATHSAAGNTIDGAAKTVAASGLSTIYAGAEVARYFGTGESDARYPDIFGLVTTGVVYTGGKSKIAEHGGAGADDRDVPLVVSTVGASGNRDDRDDSRSRTVDSVVETTQIAPTILKLLGLDPKQLQAVRIEGTDVLPRR
ncbi:MAG: phosphodiesterase, partial [Microbacteriaceae bacterium]|nr:phosphodiesterase [Microbacteriaceae bacterium]